MAQTKKRRKRKHRGTQGGRIDTRPKGKPANRAEARSRAQARRKKAPRQAKQDPRLRPPTWQSAILKGLFAAVVFFALLYLVFKRPVGASLSLAAFMMVFYVPVGYYTDRFFYQRRMGQAEREKVERARRRSGE